MLVDEIKQGAHLLGRDVENGQMLDKNWTFTKIGKITYHWTRVGQTLDIDIGWTNIGQEETLDKKWTNVGHCLKSN